MTKEQCKAIRLYHRLSQKAFAEKLGYATNYMSRVERGETPLTPHLAHLITLLFPISTSYRDSLSTPATSAKPPVKRKPSPKFTPPPPPVRRLTRHAWEKLKSIYDNRCLSCGKQGQRLAQAPRDALGHAKQNVTTNIIPLCRTCIRMYRHNTLALLDLQMKYKKNL